MTSQRFIFIGDVHGCKEELQELLSKVEFKQGEDDLIFVGDLVDRGPESPGVVKMARQLGARSSFGNHEDKHARWRVWEDKIRSGNASKNPMRRFDDDRLAEHNALDDDDIAYINAMPKLIRPNPNWIVVHAGFESTGVPPDEQSRSTICRVRNVDANGRMATNNKNPLIDVAGSVPWAVQWKGPENVVYGHAVHSLEYPRIDHHDGYICYGIDTGCVFGGHLTALVVASEKLPDVVQVKAKREYSPWRNRGNENE